MTRLLRLAPWLVAALVVAPVAVWVAFTALLNLALPTLLNQQPERVWIHYDAAWMVVPGRLEIRGLEIRNQGLRDQWWLVMASASAQIPLRPLLSRELVVRDLRAENGSFRYRRRLGDGEVATPHQPPIPGLENPPVVRPEELYGTGKKWRVTVERGIVYGVEEAWVGDFRYVGPATAHGSCALGGPVVSADVALAMGGGALLRGETPVADAIRGRFSFELADLEKAVGLRQETLDLVTSHAAIAARIEGFDFLDFYLQYATWLRLDGTGQLVLSAGLNGGRIEEGSFFRADTRDLGVQFLGYAVHGDAVVSGRVAPVDGVPQSQVSVQYGEFSIAEPDGEALVTGQGFRVGATSASVRLYEPFHAMTVVVDVPESEIPDFARFDSHLPGGSGYDLTGGTGKVEGKMTVLIPGEIATGDLHVTGDDVRGRFDGLDVAADLALHVHLEEGNLAERSYDFSGSRLDIRRFKLADPALLVGESPWSATVRVREGRAKVGAQEWLTAGLALESTDTMPFVILFTRKKPLAPWVRELIAVRDVSGTATVTFGDEIVRVEDLDLQGRQFQVLLDWERSPAGSRASLFARYGLFSLGVGVDGPEPKVHLVNARNWYARRTGGEPGAVVVAEEPDAGRSPREEKREERKRAREEEE